MKLQIHTTQDSAGFNIFSFRLFFPVLPNLTQTLLDQRDDSVTVRTSASINGPFTPHLLRQTVSPCSTQLNKDKDLMSNSAVFTP